MRLTFALPGMHRVNRGAEVALESIAEEIARLGLDEVTVLGSGPPRTDRSYRYHRFGLVPRERFERFPKIPPFRSENTYEELTWVAKAARAARRDADVTVSCSYPFVNQALTRSLFRKLPAHIYVTQNGDWPSYSDCMEYRLFTCDGLVCTNPRYFDRNRLRRHCALIPNGVDTERFVPTEGDRERLGLPVDRPIVLMVSALVESKRVLEGLRAISLVPEVHLVVAGDGPLRNEFDVLAEQLMPGRAQRMTLSAEEMPLLYNSCDVMLHPTFWESFGNAYVEALAVGLPVVAHDYEVTRWIFGDNAGLVDAGDSIAIAVAVEGAIRGGRSESIAIAPAVAQRFSWATIARQYREFFMEVVMRKESRP